MSGLDIIFPTGNANTGARAYTRPPITDGLELWAYLGADENSTYSNRAGLGLTPATEVGNVPVSNDRIVGNSSNYLTWPIKETNSFTIITVVRGVDTDQNTSSVRSFFAGWKTNEGAGIYAGGPDIIRAISKWNGVDVTSSLTGIDVTQDRLIAFVVDESSQEQTIYDLTDDISDTDSGVLPRNLSSIDVRSVGSPGSPALGASESSFLSVYSKALSKSQIDENAVLIKKFLLEQRSLSV